MNLAKTQSKTYKSQILIIIKIFNINAVFKRLQVKCFYLN